VAACHRNRIRPEAPEGPEPAVRGRRCVADDGPIGLQDHSQYVRRKIATANEAGKDVYLERPVSKRRTEDLTRRMKLGAKIRVMRDKQVRYHAWSVQRMKLGGAE
jgi:hypothetical protein